MKKPYLLFGSMVLVALVLAAGPALCAPRVVVMSPVYDAGEVPQGKDIAHDFLFKNTGDEPLTIKPRPC
ncbi:MAG TPA: hypothetical protein PKM41_11075 [Deltaproteobacteria bacterium]|jgi:hypothetical protein|nr:hypothetical protein [Deltaproteobacteria bacterium]HOI07273.1 hypothetical protein [Deltaproteobacteria bacterium]